MGLKPTDVPTLNELSNFFDVPVSIMNEVISRGRGAYGNNLKGVRLLSTGEKGVNAPRSAKMSINQWSRARLYSFLDKGRTYQTADADLARKAGF